MEQLKAGLNINFPNREKFQPAIFEIIEFFSKQWYITHGIPSMKLAQSYYSAILMKPTENFQQMFNIEREVIVIFNTYEKFQPRSLDAIDHIRKTQQALRFEEICSIIISKDENIENEIKNYLKSNQESQIVIPFAFKEFKRKKDDPNFVIYLTPPEIVHEDRVENLGSLVISSLFGYGLGLRNPGWPSGRTSRRGNTVRPGPLP